MVVLTIRYQLRREKRSLLAKGMEKRYSIKVEGVLGYSITLCCCFSAREQASFCASFVWVLVPGYSGK